MGLVSYKRSQPTSEQNVHPPERSIGLVPASVRPSVRLLVGLYATDVFCLYRRVPITLYSRRVCTSTSTRERVIEYAPLSRLATNFAKLFPDRRLTAQTAPSCATAVFSMPEFYASQLVVHQSSCWRKSVDLWREFLVHGSPFWGQILASNIGLPVGISPDRILTRRPDVYVNTIVVRDQLSKQIYL